MKLESKELTQYIESIKKAIDSSCEGNFKLTSNIEFELAIINSKGKFEDQSISKIKFTMGYVMSPAARITGS